ncbi:MAG TPA: hypothetical protein VKR06_37145 [Ktedonosporobacter sp.]|nr:hypothetical protein [Ktedonosporobacter sp.]
MSQETRRSPRRYRLYSVGEILTFILEAPESYPLQLVDHTLVHRRAERAVRIDVTWQGDRYPAIILTRSSDWYRFSLHLYAMGEVQLVIAGTHDSCLLLPVLSFDTLLAGEKKDGTVIVHPDKSKAISPLPLWYQPEETRWSLRELSDAFRKTEYGHAMLIGGLMCKLPEAYQRLADIPSKDTRLKINREVQRLQHRRPGRPIKILAKEQQSA